MEVFKEIKAVLKEQGFEKIVYYPTPKDPFYTFIKGGRSGKAWDTQISSYSNGVVFYRRQIIIHVDGQKSTIDMGELYSHDWDRRHTEYASAKAYEEIVMPYLKDSANKALVEASINIEDAQNVFDRLAQYWAKIGISHKGSIAFGGGTVTSREFSHGVAHSSLTKSYTWCESNDDTQEELFAWIDNTRWDGNSSSYIDRGMQGYSSSGIIRNFEVLKIFKAPFELGWSGVVCYHKTPAGAVHYGIGAFKVGIVEEIPQEAPSFEEVMGKLDQLKKYVKNNPMPISVDFVKNEATFKWGTYQITP